MSAKRTETRILSAALYELARTIQSGDGVANAAIAEAAERLDEQTVEIGRLRSAREAETAMYDKNCEMLRLRLTAAEAAIAAKDAALERAAEALDITAEFVLRRMPSGTAGTVAGIRGDAQMARSAISPDAGRDWVRQEELDKAQAQAYQTRIEVESLAVTRRQGEAK